MEKAINDYNKVSDKNCRIKSITANNIYSIAAFLYASDMSRPKFEEEIWTAG